MKSLGFAGNMSQCRIWPLVHFRSVCKGWKNGRLKQNYCSLGLGRYKWAVETLIGIQIILIWGICRFPLEHLFSCHMLSFELKSPGPDFHFVQVGVNQE